MNTYTLGEALLKIVDVNLSFGEKKVLSDFNAEIRNIHRDGMQQGQVIAIVAPSGCGKTQLFRTVAGLQEPNSGKVLIGPKETPVNTGDVGVVPQNYPLFWHMNVLDNLVIAAEVKGVKKKEAVLKAQALLEKFGMKDKGRAYPAELSGGQRQRVCILQQLIASALYLCMDEPFSGLDVLMKQKAIDLILEVSRRDEAMTILVTTHDVESAVEIADTIWLIGRTFDEKGVNQGASIKRIIDLAAMGLAWRPEIKTLPEFRQVVNEIKEMFKTL